MMRFLFFFLSVFVKKSCGIPKRVVKKAVIVICFGAASSLMYFLHFYGFETIPHQEVQVAKVLSPQHVECKFRFDQNIVKLADCETVPHQEVHVAKVLSPQHVECKFRFDQNIVKLADCETVPHQEVHVAKVLSPQHVECKFRFDQNIVMRTL